MGGRQYASSTAHPQSSIATLDLARALAALTVFFVHIRNSSFVEFGSLPAEDQHLATRIFFSLTRLGHEAVLVFFVLSGYFVGGQILSRLKSGSFRFPVYAIDRISRIMIPLVPACLLTYSLGTLISGSVYTFTQLVGNMVGLNGILVDTTTGNSPLWSLSYEIWFYILAGSVALIWQGQLLITALLMVIAALSVFGVLSGQYLLFWVMGAVVAVSPIRGPAVSGLGIFAIIVGVAGYQFGTGSKSIQTVTIVPIQVCETLVSVGFACIIPLLKDVDSLLKSRWIRSTAAFGGAISYSVYLFHFPLNDAVSAFLPRSGTLDKYSLLAFVARAVIVFSGCLAMWWLFERRTDEVRWVMKTWMKRRGTAL